MLRRTKNDLITKLPEKIEMNISLGLSPMQVKIYKEILTNKSSLAADFKQGLNFVKPSCNFRNVLMQLRKTINHPYMHEGVENDDEDEFGEHLVENSPKMQFLDKLLVKVKKQKDQVIIFSQFTTMLDILEDFCDMRDINFCRIDGTTDLEDRAE